MLSGRYEPSTFLHNLHGNSGVAISFTMVILFSRLLGDSLATVHTIPCGSCKGVNLIY